MPNAHRPACDRNQADSVQQLRGSLARLDDRVRRWSNTRWMGPSRDGRPRAEVASDLAVALAGLARQAGSGAPPTDPPRLAPHGVADQLAVVGRELLDAPAAAAYAEAAAAAVERVSRSL